MTSRLRKGIIGLVLFVPLLVFLADFGDIYFRSVPDAPQIQTIHATKVTLFTIAIIGGGTFMFLVIYSHIRGSSRTVPEPIKPGEHRTLFGVFLSVVTLLMVVTVLLSAGGLATMGRAPSTDAATAGQASPHLDVQVVAHQWAWKFNYRNPNVGGKYTLRVPAGTYVHLHVTSTDVDHSFSSQELGIKIDAIPGQTNDYWFKTPANKGTYQINCAELCGAGHSHMKAQLIVMPRKKFTQWAKQQGGNFTYPNSQGGS